MSTLSRLSLALLLSSCFDGAYSLSATQVWVNQQGGSKDDIAQSVACDVSRGSVFIAGKTWSKYGTYYRSTDIMDYYSDFLAAKFSSSNGALQWTYHDLSGKSDEFNAVGVDASTGDPLLAGTSTGKWYCPSADSCPQQATIYLRDDFVAGRLKVATGEPMWRWQEGTKGLDYIYGAAVSPSGDWLLVGGTDGSYGSGAKRSDPGRDNRYYPYDSDFVAIRLTEYGKKLWTYQLGFGTRGDVFNDAAYDTAGNAIIVGDSYGLIAGKYGAGIYVVKLSAGGTKVWDWKQLPTSAASYSGKAVAVDKSQNIYIAGTAPNSKGHNDFYVTKISSAGATVWTWVQDTGGDDILTGVTIGDDGTVVVAGYTSGTLAGFAKSGAYDFVAIGLDPTTKAVKWQWQKGTSASDRILAVCNAGAGKYVLAGDTSGAYSGANKGGRDLVVLQLKVA